MSDCQLNRVTWDGVGAPCFRFQIPLVDIQGYWTPETRTPRMTLPWCLELLSASQKNFPALVFLNSAGQCRALVALSRLERETRIVAQMNQEECTYDVTVETLPPAEGEALVLTVDRRPIPWMQAFSEWREGLGLPTPHIPAAAWRPVFCTWYAVHATVDAAWVEENARIAAELGIGTMIVDDGWCFDQRKRVSPQTLGTWYENIGDWRVSQVKFPDFDDHVRRVQSLGLKYLLWVTPYLIGTRSQACAQEFADALLPGGPKEGCRILDVNRQDKTPLMADRLSRLLRETPIDGLKVDFLDNIPPSWERPVGAAAMAFVRELSRQIREARPEALVEFRQSYCTPGMAPYATQFRCSDVPFDFIDNFQRLAQLRVALGDGLPVHADPIYWAPGERDVNVSRHLIASLLGTPMLSMDLRCLTPRERRIIAFWLKFYNENLPAYQTGRWSIRYQAESVGYALLQAPGRPRIAILQEPSLLPELLKRTASGDFLLNLSLEDLPVPNATTLFHPSREDTAATAGILPAGGAAVRA